MKLSFATVFFLAASLMHANATNEPLKPTPPKTAVLSPAMQFAPATESLRKKDVFSSVASTEAVVGDIVGRFQTLYAEEMSHSSLLASVATVLKAERTNVRGELMQKEMDTGGLGIDFVEETQIQQYRLFLLMKYQFASTVLGHNRPYVTVMRLTMDCYNVSSDAVDTNTDEQVEYDNAATSPVRLACDVLEHMDLPRRNESIKSIPDYIQRQIAHSAPPSYRHNHSLHVYYDAIEAQDLASDNDGKAIANRDTMHYVKFRVQGGNARDCVIAVEHANGINTLRYLDTVCYDSADADAAMAAAVAGTSSHFALDRSNAPAFVLIASIAGACVAILLVWRQRHRQRSGYSYLSSNTSKLSAVPTPGTTNTDAAVAC